MYIVSASFSERVTTHVDYIRGVCISYKEADELMDKLDKENPFQEFERANDFGYHLEYQVEEIEVADACGKPTIPVYFVTANYENADGNHFDHFARHICGVKTKEEDAMALVKMLRYEDDPFQNRQFADLLGYHLTYRVTAIKTNLDGMITSINFDVEEIPIEDDENPFANLDTTYFVSYEDQRRTELNALLKAILA